LFLFDALSFQTHIFKVKRRDDNPLNGKNPSITQLLDYEFFCGLKTGRAIREITVQEFHQWRTSGESFQLIDVREPHEYEAINLGGELIPLATVSDNRDRFSKDVKVVVHCRSGGRSARAIRELEATFGLDNLYNLQGGLLAYHAGGFEYEDQ